MTRERLIRLGWALGALIAMAIAVGPGFNNFTAAMMGNAVTVDYPWLLESGRHIIATGTLPQTDMFSWTHADKPWVLYQWLFEVGLAGAERAIGLDALLRMFMLAVVAIYVFVPLFGGVPRRVPFVLTVTVGSIALIIVTLNMSIRPGFMTTLFLMVQFLTLAAMRRGRLGTIGGVAIVAPVYLLWGNIHMGVILGILSLLLMLAGDALEWAGWRRFDPADPEIEGRALAPKVYGIVIAAAFLASLVNPYGLHIYERIIDVSSQAGHTANVDELQALNMQWAQGQLLLLLLGGFMVTLTWSSRALAAQEILHLVVFTAMAMVAARLVLWPALFYALILPKALHHVWTEVKTRRPAFEPLFGAAEEFRPMVAGMLLLFGVGITVVAPQAVAESKMGLCQDALPGLRQVADLRRPQDRMFNDPTSGSCMLLVDPAAKVFIDPRFDFYGQDFLSEVAWVMRLEADWRDLFARWQVDTALVRKHWPLAGALAASGEFETLYEDESIVYFRKREGG